MAGLIQDAERASNPEALLQGSLACWPLVNKKDNGLMSRGKGQRGRFPGVEANPTRIFEGYQGRVHLVNPRRKVASPRAYTTWGGGRQELTANGRRNYQPVMELRQYVNTVD